jgi:hypothetical protein
MYSQGSLTFEGVDRALRRENVAMGTLFLKAGQILCEAGLSHVI